ncbi:MAG TPA: secondary thiamine-phosphate synthase enzyme YjbQ [Gammaproteobacteria bacterium]|nr:secondary thiamine-phosphate synthase enzyme YjbQ [Gammaproteobacteria bacterium]
MNVSQQMLEFPGRDRGTREISAEVAGVVAESGIRAGLCQVFSRHTSAGVIITENADAEVRRDHERLLAHLVPDGWEEFRHRAEGDDDMSAHARTLLAGEAVLVPVRNGKLGLGRWQGIFLWEHRRGAHRREIVITVIGE